MAHHAVAIYDTAATAVGLFNSEVWVALYEGIKETFLTAEATKTALTTVYVRSKDFMEARAPELSKKFAGQMLENGRIALEAGNLVAAGLSIFAAMIAVHVEVASRAGSVAIQEAAVEIGGAAVKGGKAAAGVAAAAFYTIFPSITAMWQQVLLFLDMIRWPLAIVLAAGMFGFALSFGSPMTVAQLPLIIANMAINTMKAAGIIGYHAVTGSWMAVKGVYIGITTIAGWIKRSSHPVTTESPSKHATPPPKAEGKGSHKTEKKSSSAKKVRSHTRHDKTRSRASKSSSRARPTSHRGKSEASEARGRIIPA